ncbi:polysaccharide deacetylase [Umezawaea tangerina]|uniref:polysaccharide deacetylase n=1 Tax=Umezawaea tangerina TaxID=84725 RepID=UPI001FE5D39E|nr:polysaccharide deacetylase [Umezawaea tangerina]
MTTGVALGVTMAVLITIGRTPEQGATAPENVAAGLPAPPRTPVDTSDVPVVPPPAEPRAEWMHKLGPNEKPPQFVMFSFDGAASKEHWDRVLPIARDAKAHVTGLLSGVYMLTESEGATGYTGPGHDRGESAIDFGGSRQDVDLRIGYLNDAIAAGHEIGTHYNGHFCKGTEPSVGTWNTDQWNNELDQFFAIIDKSRARGFALDPANIRGGRTPCLEADWKAAFPAMKSHGLVYDTSHVSLGVTWPTVIDGVYEFPLPEVKVPALNKQAVMMDFNLWSVLNGAKEQPERAAEFSSVVVDTYRDVYRTVFNGNRAPLTIGNHFNEWAGGAFADAVEKFMGEVCVLKDTVCATYTEVIQWMQLQDPSILAQLRSFPAARN